jgi:hypothetical protein
MLCIFLLKLSKIELDSSQTTASTRRRRNSVGAELSTTRLFRRARKRYIFHRLLQEIIDLLICLRRYFHSSQIAELIEIRLYVDPNRC